MERNDAHAHVRDGGSTTHRMVGSVSPVSLSLSWRYVGMLHLVSPTRPHCHSRVPEPDRSALDYLYVLPSIARVDNDIIIIATDM